MSAADFNAMLQKLPTKQIVFVNTSSSSGPFVEALSGAGPDDRHGDAQRRRAVRDGVRRLLHRRADLRSRRRRQEQARQRARSVQLREGGSRARLRAAGAAGHRARAARRQRRQGRQSGARASPARTARSVPTARWPASCRSAPPGAGLPNDPKLRALYMERQRSRAARWRTCAC